MCEMDVRESGTEVKVVADVSGIDEGTGFALPLQTGSDDFSVLKHQSVYFRSLCFICLRYINVTEQKPLPRANYEKHKIIEQLVKRPWRGVRCYD